MLPTLLFPMILLLVVFLLDLAGFLDIPVCHCWCCRPCSFRWSCCLGCSCYCKRESDTRFSISGFFRKSVSPWTMSICLWDRFDFFRKFVEIIANGCCSGVSTTPAIKEKNFQVKFFFIFCEELSCVYITPKDEIFASFSFSGVGKLI